VREAGDHSGSEEGTEVQQSESRAAHRETGHESQQEEGQDIL